MSLRNKAAIIGIGETEYVKGSPHSEVELMLRASLAAIEDAGLKSTDIDAIIPPPVFTTAEELAANLGITDLRYSTTVHMGGASPVAALQSATMAVATGVATHVLIPFGWNGYSDTRVSRREARGAHAPPSPENAMSRSVRNYYAPYGALARVQYYAWISTRHREQYGTTDEQMGQVALACRAHAQHNPRAYMYGRP